MLEEMDANLFTLEDEKGIEREFELLDKMEVKGVTYYALTPIEDIESDANLIILKEDVNSGDSDMLVTIDDDEEYESIGTLFIERLENYYEDDADDYEADEDEEGEGYIED